MASRTSSSNAYAPNVERGPISDEDLIRGFLLALGAGGRKKKTLLIYEDSIRMLSEFTRELGLPGLAAMDRNHVCHWLTSLHRKGNGPATVSVLYRSLNLMFRWRLNEGERPDNPMDRVGPPKIPDTIQPYHSLNEVETILNSIGRQTAHNLRDSAMILTLYDTGVRAVELWGMRVEELDWRDRTILVL